LREMGLLSVLQNGKDSIAETGIRLATGRFGRIGVKVRRDGRLRRFVFSIDSFGCVWLMGVCENAKRIRRGVRLRR
jgi:hypothetical protein